MVDMFFFVVDMVFFVVGMGGNEKAVAVNLLCVVSVEGVEVVGEEFGDDPVWVWLIWQDEGTDKLRIVLKFGVGEVAKGDRGKRRVGEVIFDWELRSYCRCIGNGLF